MQADETALLTEKNTDGSKPISEETFLLINKAIDAVHNLKYLNLVKQEDRISHAKEKNKKLLERVYTLHIPHSISLHFSMIILMGSLTKAPLTSLVIMLFSALEDKRKSAEQAVESLEILKREVTHPTENEQGLSFQTALPAIAQKVLTGEYNISPKTSQSNSYQSLRESASLGSGEPQQNTQKEENPALVKKGETLALVIKEILSRNKMLATYSDVEYEKFISIATDQILQDQKRYNLTGATRQELLAGTSIDRAEIEKLIKGLETKIASGEIAKNQQKETLTEEDSSPKTYSEAPDPSVSNVVASWRDNIHQDFLTDGFRAVVKKVCALTDTTNLEKVFIKYCDISVSKLTEAIKSEAPDIQKEVLAFLTWVRKSYLSSQKPEIFEKLPFYSVIEAVARGVNGTSASGTATNTKIVIT